jgi:hypothetical protein
MAQVPVRPQTELPRLSKSELRRFSRDVHVSYCGASRTSRFPAKM